MSDRATTDRRAEANELRPDLTIPISRIGGNRQILQSKASSPVELNVKDDRGHWYQLPLRPDQTRNRLNGIRMV